MSKVKKSRAGNSISAMNDALQRFKPLLGEQNFRRLLGELQQPLQQALRVNTQKNADPAESVSRWAEMYGWQIQPIPYCDTGWQIRQAKVPVSQPIEHRMGYYYIQDAASMLPVSLFKMDPSNSPLILDMAASPGGKTTHLVDRSGDLGFVVANDSGRDRITMLRMVLQNWGALNTAVTRFPGEKFGQWYPDTFDRVLLDAPCSMQNLRSTEARPMHTISSREIQTLSHRQQHLLWSALQAVKAGGQVVYSTCSLDPEEDEVVLDAVLERAGAAIKIETVDDLVPVSAAGLSSITADENTTVFHPQVGKAVRLWPHLLKTSGFFAALITKQQSLPVEKEPAPKIASSLDLIPLKSRDARQITDQLLQCYGFDFKAVMEAHGLALWQRQNVLYAIPDAWWKYFNQLPFQAVGMRVAELDNGLTPSHEWVARFGDDFQKGVLVISGEQTTAWLRGEDLTAGIPAGMPTTGIVAVRDELGRLYGRGKAGSSRLRNLLPNRWVVSG